MADYYQLKNQNIFNPPANTSLGNSTNQFGNAFVQNDLILGNVTVTGATINTPKVSTITYPGDDTAADPAGGQTITLTGSGFLAGASVLINGSAVGVVSVVSSTTITFTSPANSTGSYVLYVINTDGGTAIAIPGIQYSGVPTWTTAAGSLGSVYETNSFNQTVTATGDAPITYSLFSGSIPPGATFNSNGTITGTSQLLSSSTTYTFIVRATDAELQDTNRSFSLTISPDVVTWASPANGTTYTSSTNSAISNVTLSATSAVGSGITYTANALPTGLSLAGANISGTPTVVANSSSLLTATANTTSELSSITINWIIGVSNDIFFEYNTLLIPGASTTFVDDASTNNFAVTINGDTKPNNTNPYTPGYYSGYFNNTANLSVPTNDAFNFGTGDFTLEAWIYRTALPENSFIISASGTGGLFWGFATGGDIGWGRAGVAWDYQFAANIVASRWYHVAVTRSGTSMKMFVNGTQLGVPQTNSTSYNISTSSLCIGSQGGNYYFEGNISNARIVKGTAVYTANFTPSTTPLTAISGTSLLACQSNRFIDNSTNTFTITTAGTPTIKSFQPFTPNSSYSTYGSGYFDGTGDYLNTPSSAALTASGDFTIEAWVYIVAGGTAGGFILTQGASTSGILLGMSSANILTFKLGSDSGGFTVTDTVALPLNTWIHVAGVRSGNTLTLYKNGVSAGSTGSVNNTAVNTVAVMGRYYTDYNGFYFNGYISDARLVVGTAVYTTTFTPPSAPLTAISGTSLLTLQNNQSVNNNVFLDNSTNNFFVTRNGNTTQGTFSPYGGNWSNYFDGTGDYLSVPNNTSLNLWVGDFTIEMWVYSNANQGNYTGLVAKGGGAATGWQMVIVSNSVNVEVFGSTLFFSPSTTLPNNQWVHLAIVKSGTNVSLFQNGTRISAITGSSTTYSNTTDNVNIGTERSAGIFFNGYISNIRLVKGTAVYDPTQSSFTPSSTPLTAITNTSLLTCQSNRLIDTSINNLTITKVGDTTVQRFSPFNPSSVTSTSYSGYFDGNGDYLNVASNAAFAFGTSDFTLEFWAYPTVNARQDWLDFDSGGGYRLLVYYDGSNIVYYSGGSRITGSAMTLNTWQHIAVVRNSGSTKLYINGSQSGSTYSDSINFLAQQLTIAKDNAGSTYVTGYMSNVRVVKGVAVYTGTFTVPTSPLTATQSSGTNIAAITGTSTSLLTLQSPTFIDNSTNNFTITAFGNSQPTQQNPFGFTSATTTGYTVSTIGGSGYFDGNGDFLSFGSSYLPTVAGTAFTLEFWIYSTKDPSIYTSIIASGNMQLNLSDGSFTGQIRFDLPTGVANVLNSGDVRVKSNSWNHIVLTRTTGNDYTLYLNGVKVGTGNSSTAITTLTTFAYSNTNSVLGYISDLRVTNSLVYTANFVPPTSPLTAVQNSTLLLNMISGGMIDYTMMNNMETVADAKLSTAISKFGGSSMSFDGTGDCLYSPATPNLTFGTGDFTIEMWVNPTSLSSTLTFFFGMRPATTNGFYPVIYADNTGTYWYVNSVNRISGGVLSTNTWTHMAVCRSGSSTKMFFNGTQTGGTFTDTSNYLMSRLYIGASDYNSGTSEYLTGYIDDLRVTKGYARYTSNFTAPTSAFPIY